jgi:valyl-tRNA synthetase
LVQKELKKRSINYTRDTLNDHIWEWKGIYEKHICDQVKALGVSVDWDYYTFTLDPGPQKGVIEAFCRLYEKNLIFRGNKILNWDIELQSVISDIESINKEVDGTLYYIKYFTDDGDVIEVATVRPETIFADAAIAIHPDDVRYKDFVGKYFNVPLTNKKIPIVTDSRCEIDKGTGALKIDPAHGFLDFEIGIKYNLPVESIIDKNGKMCGDIFVKGLDRFEARIATAAKLEEIGAITRTESIKHHVPYGARSDSVLEPMILDQWFLDMPKLRARAEEILNEIELVPDSFKAIYMEYMSKIEPWCISRQISWGHKIPCWYDNDNNLYVARSYDEAKQMSKQKQLRQDTDVLDTWFSSALWPMLTLGWPDKELQAPLYPNECLITGHDILFFWATKMIVMHIALFGNESVPFKSIKLHGLVQDETGLKMSKSKGNVIDPISLCNEYGTDVVSFALIYTATTGHNIKFGLNNIDKSKKFLTKIWNAFNLTINRLSKIPVPVRSEFNTYILKKLLDCEAEIATKIKSWNIYNAADELYNFFWTDFCSWHLEIAKYLSSTELKDETSYTLYFVMRKLLKIMHPFLPTITEYFWQKLGETDNILIHYTDLEMIQTQVDETKIDKLRKMIWQLRSVKDRLGLSNNIEMLIDKNFPQLDIDIMNHLMKVDIKHGNLDADGLIKFSFDGITIGIKGTQLDPTKLQTKLDLIIDSVTSNLELLSKQLSDSGFMKHADSELINNKQKHVQELTADLDIYLKTRNQYFPDL